MRSLRRALVAFLLTPLGAFAACLALSAPATARVPQGYLGVVLDGPVWPPARSIDLRSQLGTMARSGAENIVFAVSWANTEPYASWSEMPANERSQFTSVDGRPLRLGQLDQIFTLAAARGMSVLPRVIGAPDWDALPDNGGVVRTPARVAPYASFLTALIHRYGPRGSLWKGRPPRQVVRRWQIWSEPNLQGWWATQPNFVPGYVALLRAAHTAIKAADPHAQVVMAGLADSSWLDLARIYRVRGVSSLFDVVAIHPYTARPAGVLTILDNARNVMKRAHDRNKAIIADEVGWNSSLGQSPDHFGVETDQKGQASRVAQVMDILSAYRRHVGLLGIDVYSWAGTDAPASSEFNFAGLFHYTGTSFVAKPAFGAFRQAALRLEGCRVKVSATRCTRRA